MVFDPRAEDALVVIRTNLFGAVISNTLSEECGDILWLYGQYRSADDLIIYRREIFRFAEHFPSCFVVPGLVSITAFHSGENMNQTFRGSFFRDNFLNTVVFAESMEFPDEFNFDPVLLRGFFSILTDLLCKGLGKSRVIKNADIIELHIGGHGFRMAPVWDISLDDHAVITGNDTINLISVFICK